MRKIMAMLLLALASSSARAEWIELGSNDVYTSYADPATISKSGTTVKVSYLHNFKTVQVKDGAEPFTSMSSQDEYDCKEQQWRTLAITLFSGAMGTGEAVQSFTYADSAWAPIQSGSEGQALLKFGCGKQ